MKAKRIFILLGHPNSDTLSGAVADAYEKAARDAGHEVRRANIGDLAFDPILHKGYKAIQQLEPDLLKVQEDIKWCEHFVVVYPIWWSGMPALLKGMIERMWLPAFAFRFIKGPDGKTTMGWNKLLAGRTSRVVVLLKNFPPVERFMFGNYTAEMVDAILRFSGFRVRLTQIGNSEMLSDRARESWMRAIASLGRKAA